jgi:hypothetical protein
MSETSSKKYFLLTFIISISISLWLACTTYYINFWPTDSCNAYTPAAAKLFDQKFISEVHEAVGFQLIMRGKETLILGIALMQRLLGDFKSLYPATLLLIIVTNGCSILIFQIFKNLFNPRIAFVAFLLFTGSFWPYMYVLQVSHPPMVLMNLLLALWFVQWSKENNLSFPRKRESMDARLEHSGTTNYSSLAMTRYFVSGIFLGFMLFSSPTSPIYLPYYVAFVLYQVGKRSLREYVVLVATILVGILLPVLYFTLPNPTGYLTKFRDFLNYSKKGNDFIIWRHVLEKYFSFPETFRGGGVIWIIKYFFLILPILFSVYLVSLMYLGKAALRNKMLWLVILVSLSTPILVELSQVAQFGRNYFSWFIGMILAVCWALYLFLQSKPKRTIIGFLIGLLSLHVVLNLFIFVRDIFPSRLASTRIYQWLIQHDVKRVFAYREHPLNKNIVQYMVNPKAKKPLSLVPIQTIAQVSEGYILVSPMTGKSVLNACSLEDYSADPVLTLLYQSGELNKYVVASFKTLSSSRFWAQEEEVCAYRDLVLRQIGDEDRQKGYAWILDAKKLREEALPKLFKK